ncbi:MAG: PIG-L family deacetylase [Oscillospiraceae bacterium]|nr:PIG-L family deacetylase [Oscillospiraceae bacterium]
MKKCLLTFSLVLLCAILCCTFALADGPAELLNGKCSLLLNGGYLSGHAFDDDEQTWTTIPAGSELHVKASEPVSAVYLKFDRPIAGWTLTVAGETRNCGGDGFIHELVDGFSETELVLSFPERALLCDIYFFSAGDLPDWVQRWEPPLEKADLLMLTTHSDDDQLYFAGMVASSVAKGYSVQLALFVNHWNERVRPHEILNGLWECGMRNYPLIDGFRDLYSETAEECFSYLAAEGCTREMVLERQTELLRRFHPQVIAVHDLEGEYGHGAHMANAETALEAVELANDSEAFPESAERWGVWEVPKVYVHLYGDDPTVLDLDTPLEEFGGRTAFRVSQDGFRWHNSQLIWKGFYNWMYGQDLASEIQKYSPCLWGLWRSTVGEDEEKNDLFEHIVSYAEQERIAEEERLAQEEAERAEQERLEQEAAAKAEQERLEQEAAAKAEQERLEQEAAAKAEQERLEQESREEQETEKQLLERSRLPICLALGLVLVIVLVLLLSKKKRGTRK